MSQGLDTMLTFLTLDALHVGEHTTLGIISGKQIRDQSITMELSNRQFDIQGKEKTYTSQSDELPNKPEFTNIRDEGLDFIIRHASGIPVKGR